MPINKGPVPPHVVALIAFLIGLVLGIVLDRTVLNRSSAPLPSAATEQMRQ